MWVRQGACPTYEGITTNWSDFVKTSWIGERQICVLVFKAKRGKLLLAIYLL
uniref:Uncharacterized protein n=1 Tax=Triticum urartu TaxID=4572 RepID=A0A8R7NZI5_TRIUA